MIQVRISGSGNLAPLKREIAGVEASMHRLNTAYVKQMDVHKRIGDTQGMVDTHRAWTQQLEAERRALIRVTKAQGDYQVSSMKVARATDVLADRIQKNKFSMKDWMGDPKEIENLYKRQVALRQSVGMTYGSTDAGSSRVDVMTPNNIQMLNKRVDEARQKMGFYGQVMNSVSTSTINWGKNTQWAGRQLMAGFTYPMALAAAGTVKYAYDLDKALTQITKVYGDTGGMFRETDESIRNSATQTAKFLAKTYGQAFQETLEIQSQLASTGITGRDLQDDTVAVTKAKILGELNIQDAMKATITLQSVYKMNTEELANTFNYMNTMENQTSLTMQDFVEGIPKVSGIMRTLNSSVEETGILLTAMKTAGIDAKEGGTAIKSMVFKDLAPSAKAIKQFKEMTGKDLLEIREQTEGAVVPMLTEIGLAMDGLAGTDKVNIMKEIFGIHQGGKALGMVQEFVYAVKQQEGQVWDAMQIAKMDPTENAEIAAGELRKIQNSDWNKAKRGIESIKISIAELGEVVLGAAGPTLEMFGRMIQSISEGFNNMSKGKQNFLMMTALITGLAGPAIMMVGLFANLAGQAQKLGAALLNAAGDGMKVMTEKQNASRLALERETQAIKNKTSAVILFNRIAAAGNNSVMKMTDPRSIPDARGIAGITTKPAPRPREMVNSPKAENWRLAQDAQSKISTDSAKTERNWSGIASNASMIAVMAGGFGTMSTHSASMLNNISNALLLAGLVGPALTKGFKSATTEGGKLNAFLAPKAEKFAASSAGSKAVGWAKEAKASMAGLLLSLSAAAPVIAGVALAVGGLYYFWHKRQKEAKAAQEAMNKSVEDYASVLGVALNEEQKFEKGSKGNTFKTYKELADNALGANADLKRATDDINKQVAEMDNKFQKEAFIKNFAIQKGMEARVKGADAEGAKEVARLAAASIQSELSERIALSIDANLFVNIDTVAMGQVDSVRRGIQDVMNNLEDSTDTYVTDYGSYVTSLNDETIEKMNQDADKSWDAFEGLSGPAAQKAFQKMATDAYSGMEMSYDQLTTAQKELLKKNEGVVDGRTMAKFIDRVGGYGEMIKYMNEAGQGLSAEADKSMKTATDLLNGTMRRYAKRSGANDPEIEAILKDATNFDKLAEFDGFKVKNIRKTQASDAEIVQGQMLYNAELKRAKQAGEEYSIVKKRLLRDQWQERLGLQAGVEWNAKWTRAIQQNTQAKQDNARVKQTAPTDYYDTSVNQWGRQDGGLFDRSGAEPFTPDELMEKHKQTMTATQKDISDFAMSTLDEELAARVDAVDKEAERAADRLDKRGEEMEADFKRRSDNIDKVYDQREQWFDSRWDKKMETFESSWDNQMERFQKKSERAKEAVEAQYDARIKKIDDAIKAEQDAESQRQKIFEKEKARIQQYAQLANMAIDINMAISSGNLDEAAKLSNDAQASIETFEMEDTGAISQSASDKAVEELEKRKEVEGKKKDSALKALEARQEAEQKALEDQRKNAQKSLEIQRERDKKALSLERKSAKDRLEVERTLAQKTLAADKKATAASYADKKRREQQKSDAAKRAFQDELDALNAFIPRSETELEAHRESVNKLYDKYGVKLKTKGNDWAFIVRDRLHAHMRQAAAEMDSKVAWDQMAKRIGSRMTEGMFDMNLQQFNNWIAGGGKMPKRKVKAAKKGTRPDGTVQDNLSPLSQETRHEGGIVGTGGGSRAGYSGKNQAQSEVWVNALKGEAFLNRKATARLGKEGVDALNRGDGIGDGPGFGGLAAMMTAGFMRPVLEQAVQQKGTEQQTRDAVAAAEAAAGKVTGRFDAFWKALAQQESGGNYKAVNSLTGALGKYQVMPANVGPWSKQVLGKSISTSTFLNTPALQDKIVRGILGGYYKKWGARGAAAAWYAGPANHDLHMSTRPQPGGPSIKGYVDAIVKRMKGYLSSGAGNQGPAGASGGVWENMGWQKMWPIVANKFPHANKTSDYRNRSITSTGNLSYHAMGRAIDITSDNGADGMMWIFKWLRRMFGAKSKEIIYSPAGGQQIKNGRNLFYSEPVRGDHWDHVHWAMKNGGLVPGRGAGDRTRIMGEPGEFMLRKKAVDHLGIDALKLLNSDKFINMPEPSLSTNAAQNAGSPVDAGSSFRYNISIDARGNENAEDIGLVLERMLDARERKHGYNRRVS